MVKGIYTNVQETLSEINKLKTEGYTVNEITVVTAQGKNPELKDLESANISTAEVTKEDHEDESTWEKIKDMFTVSHYKKGHPADNPLAEYGIPDDVANDLNYKKELEDGKILIIIDDMKELRNDSTINKL